LNPIFDHDSEGNPTLEHRYRKTLSFLRAVIPAPAHILDVGSDNDLSALMRAEGYDVTNTSGDLDEGIASSAAERYDAVTAFEILEHLINPMGVLAAVRADHLVATVPLRLWFATAYRNRAENWNSHYHEFEDWQFDWLLDRSGWRIVSSEKWTSPVRRIGIRPLFRRFTPRYYAVHARRK
jgi:Methyltransferase domain